MNVTVTDIFMFLFNDSEFIYLFFRFIQSDVAEEPHIVRCSSNDVVHDDVAVHLCPVYSVIMSACEDVGENSAQKLYTKTYPIVRVFWELPCRVPLTQRPSGSYHDHTEMLSSAVHEKDACSSSMSTATS